MKLIKVAAKEVKKRIRPKPKIKTKSVNYVNKEFVIQFLLRINYTNEDLNHLIANNNILTFNSRDTNFKIVFEYLTVEYKNNEIKIQQNG